MPQDVKRAIEYMRERLARRITIADLATASGAAERTLHKHFRAFLGLAPLAYLRQMRLAAARESLLGGAGGASVTEVALRHGFTHFGRFSAQYRRSFGESPSATLRRARARPASKVSIRERPSIAVLPPVSETGYRWYAEGFAERIAAALCSLRPVSVVLRKPAAAYCLAGRLLEAGERLRLVLHLADTASGQQVWAESYEAARGDLTGLQDRALQGVVRSIVSRIRDSESDRARRARPQDLGAHGLAMRALPFVFVSQPEASLRALELLHRAMEIDPDYGLAAGLAAWCHGQLVMYNGTSAPARERERAAQLARRAALLDDDDPLVLTARCAVHTMAREFDAADALVTRALALDPGCAWTWARSGWLNSYLGRAETAIEHFRRSIALDRYSSSRANSFVGIGSAHFGAGRYGAAASWLRKALREEPGAVWANRTLSVSYARIGERRQALASLEALRRYSPDLTVGQVVAAIPFRAEHLERLGDGLSALGLPI